MVSFELGKEIAKHVFRLVTSVSSHEAFGFLAPMLYHRATETLW